MICWVSFLNTKENMLITIIIINFYICLKKGKLTLYLTKIDTGINIYIVACPKACIAYSFYKLDIAIDTVPDQRN